MPLSFAEYLAFRDISADDIASSQNRALISRAFEQYCLWRGFPEDRGKRLENVVFRHLRAKTEDIYLARNGWECDFAVFPPGRPAQLIQVTDRLNRDNVGRELKGLVAGRQFIVTLKDCCWLIPLSRDWISRSGFAY